MNDRVSTMSTISLRKRANFYSIFNTNHDGSYSPIKAVLHGGKILNSADRLIPGQKFGWLDVGIHAGYDLDVAYHFGGTYELIGMYPKIQVKIPALM